tara:strand:- start:129 stop:338 length:210 start_codon:yes stop_codon:yes gene_type:complete
MGLKRQITIKYRKDGSIKSVYEDIDGKPYKDYTYYKNGKIKKEFNYRMNVITNFNNDKYNIGTCKRFNN